MLALGIGSTANAGIFSVLFENSAGSAATSNSQTMTLLTPPLAIDPLAARGGGDTTIVEGQALLADAGPMGTIVDIDGNTAHGGLISTYVVKEGDTLSTIADLFGVSVNTILWANNLKSRTITPGETLVILPVTGVRHTVKKGDTVEILAKRYHGDVDEILSFNELTSGTSLAVGSIIMIPNGELETTATKKPVTKPGTSSSGWLARPVRGGVRTQGLHGYNGIDIASYQGASIYAAAAGRVIVARADGGWNGGYGNYIVIAHSNGVQTLYAHLQSVKVAPGQNVAQGDVIGGMGHTGKIDAAPGHDGTHLHFEVRGARNPF